jgi:hypothetical protein
MWSIGIYTGDSPFQLRGAANNPVLRNTTSRISKLNSLPILSCCTLTDAGTCSSKSGIAKLSAA